MAAAAGISMGVISDVAAWFASAAQWSGTQGIPWRLLQHVGYSLAATVLALLIALPLGLWVGHTGRGGNIAINFSNLGRAIPSFGIIILGFFAAGIGLLPVLVVLVALALPPIVTNTYVGVRSVDAEVRDSAYGMGLTGWQVLREVEIPMAMPLIMAGVRTSAVQVVATATLAAVIGLGGLGRFIIDGLGQQNLAEVVGGALLVAALSLLTEFGLARVQSAIVSDGLAHRNREAGLQAKAATA